MNCYIRRPTAVMSLDSRCYRAVRNNVQMMN